MEVVSRIFRGMTTFVLLMSTSSSVESYPEEFSRPSSLPGNDYIITNVFLRKGRSNCGF